MALGEGGRQRGLADAAQPVQGRDRDPTLVAPQRRLDRCQRVVTAQEEQRYMDRDIRDWRDVRAGRPVIFGWWIAKLLGHAFDNDRDLVCGFRHMLSAIMGGISREGFAIPRAQVLILDLVEPGLRG